MSTTWTPERRQRQAERIREWSPWKTSTGPKSPEGKRRSAQRGYRGNQRGLIRNLRKVLREQAMLLDKLCTEPNSFQ